MQRRLGWPALMLVGMLAVLSVSSLVTSSAMAQPADDAPAAEAPAADAPAGAAPAPGGAPAARPAVPTTVLGWIVESLNWYLIPFLLMSFLLVALSVMNLLTARRATLCPPQLVEDFEQLLDQQDYPAAYEHANNDPSVLGQVLANGISRLQYGYAQAVEAMQAITEEEGMKLEHRLSYIALIGTVAPMVGLLGTVHGMVSSFSVIALNNSTPSASELAGGISTALMTTLVGLLIAIPAIIVHGLLRNRINKLLLDVSIKSEQLMSRFKPAQ